MKTIKVTKYTHLIEKCSSFLRTLTKWRLEESTGFTLTQAYWRLREGKGLISKYDQKTLDLWSGLITEFRRYVSPPFYVKADLYSEIKTEKEQVLEKMEKYREWLENGTQPTYLGGNRSWLYAKVLQECFYDADIDPVTMTTPMSDEEMEVAAAEGKLKDYSVICKEQLAFLQALNWDAVNERFCEINKLYDKFCEHVQKKIDRIVGDRSLNELTFDERRDVKEWRKYPFERFLDARDFEHKIQDIFYDKVWQIRTDFDFRSSKGAKIGEILNCIWTVESQSNADVRSLIANNDTKIAAFRQWKADRLEEKKKGADVDKEKVGSEVLAVIEAISVPAMPTIDKKEKEE